MEAIQLVWVGWHLPNEEAKAHCCMQEIAKIADVDVSLAWLPPSTR